MKLVLNILLLLCIVSCSQPPKKGKAFNYSGYTSYSLERLNIHFSIPSDFKKSQFNQEKLDELIDINNTNPNNRDIEWLISSQFKQKQGKLEIFVDTDSLNYLSIQPVDATLIDKEVLIAISSQIKHDIVNYNQYGYNIQFKGAKSGFIGDLKYAEFLTTATDGLNNTYLISKGHNSWVINHYGKTQIDMLVIMASIETVKK